MPTACAGDLVDTPRCEVPSSALQKATPTTHSADEAHDSVRIMGVPIEGVVGGHCICRFWWGRKPS